MSLGFGIGKADALTRRPNVRGSFAAPIERLEDRLFLSAASPAAAATSATAKNVVYVESNDPRPGMNAILAFKQNPATGALSPLAGSPFLAGGKGVENLDEGLGPDDSDQEVIVSKDKRFLFAVNSGSNTVAVFRINQNGSLKLVTGAPFASGGVQPCSLGLVGNTLFVVNRGDQLPGQTVGGTAPNITSFRVRGDGTLRPLNNKVTLANGVSPTQALISRDGKFVFGDNLFARQFPPPPGFPPFIPPFASELEGFKIGAQGKLTRSPGSPFGSPVAPQQALPFILGLAAHPTKNIVYSGFVASGKLGVFTYNKAGSLHFERIESATGAGICWITISPDAKRLYAANSISDTIGVFDITDPLHPRELQDLPLNGPKNPVPPGGPAAFDTTPFQLSTDPAGKFLYVVNHEATVANTSPQGNALHILKIQPDGTLTEGVTSPLVFSQTQVPANAHPQGIAIV